MDEPKQILSAYATEQKGKWDKKSFALLHTTIGFRTAPPAVEKTKKGFTWAVVIDLMKKSKLLKQFVRTKEEVNKSAILAEKDAKVLKALKDTCYVEITQDESFFIEVKKEEVKSA